MSAERGKRIIKIGRYYAELRLPFCLAAVPMALLSALSVGVFCFMRSSPEAELYYTGERSLMLFDSLGLATLLSAAVLLVFYCLAFQLIGRPRPGSVVVSLLLAFNMVVSLSVEHSGQKEISLPTGIVGNVLVLLGFAVLLYTCVELISLAFERRTRYRIWADDQFASTNGELFLGSYVCIMLLWLPILFIFYPGSVMNDTRCQIMSWLGFKPITASHPVLTTVFYGGLYQIGSAMQGQAKGIFLGLLFQALITAAAMGLTASCVYRYTKSRAWFWATVAFFGVLPVWQSAAQVLLKDVLHTGCFLLFLCTYLRCLRERKKSWGNVLLLFLTAILVAYTRRATFYLAVICILTVALWHRRTFLPQYLAILAAFMGLFWFSNNILYPMLNISTEPKSENYSMQFRQVALYCRTYQDEMTVEDKAIVDSTMDYDKIIEDYTQASSDDVKSTIPDTDEPQDAFWQLYRRMLRRHPMFFVKATIMCSFEHFNPWYDGIDYYADIDREEDFLTVDYQSPFHKNVAELWNSCLHVPVLRLLIGTGLYAWILLVVLAYGIRKKSLLAFLGLVPSLALAIGLVMRSVNGEIRYGYPLIAAAPLNMAWVLYAVSRTSPDNPHRSPLLQQEREPLQFKLFRPLTEEELKGTKFDPNEPPPELPPEEKSAADKTWKSGPVLDFVTHYVPVPRSPKTYLDVLKVLAIYLVLWNHTSTGFDLYNRVLDMPEHMLYLCTSIVDKIAVPLFFMASGALLLGREESWRKILRYRVRRFALILLIVSAINYLQYYNDNSRFSFMDFLTRLYTGSIRTPLWYLYAYLAFLLMLPFLRKMARCMQRADYIWLVVFFIVTQLLSVADFFWFHGDNYHISDFRFFTSQNYVVYALLGFYIERVMKKERMNLETLTVLIMLSVMSVGMTYILTEWRMDWFGTWTTNNSQAFLNTFIAIPSVTVFYTAKYWYTRHPAPGRKAAVWSLLATGTFGTYLFERFWRDNTEFVFDVCMKKLNSFTSSLIHILAACVLGILATLLYKIVTGMLINRFQRLMGVRKESRKKPDMVYTVPEEDISDLEEIESLLVGSAQHKAEVRERKDSKE